MANTINGRTVRESMNQDAPAITPAFSPWSDWIVLNTPTPDGTWFKQGVRPSTAAVPTKASGAGVYELALRFQRPRDAEPTTIIVYGGKASSGLRHRVWTGNSYFKGKDAGKCDQIRPYMQFCGATLLVRYALLLPAERGNTADSEVKCRLQELSKMLDLYDYAFCSDDNTAVRSVRLADGHDAFTHFLDHNQMKIAVFLSLPAFVRSRNELLHAAGEYLMEKADEQDEDTEGDE